MTEELKYTEILKRNSALIGKNQENPYRIGILSNVTVNSLTEILSYNCRLNQLEPKVEIGNFDNIVQDSGNFTNQDLVIIFYDMLNIVDNVADFFEDLSDEKTEQLKSKIKSELSIVFENLKNSTSVVINSFSSKYFVDNYLSQTKLELFVLELNQWLRQSSRKNVTIIDIDKIFNSLGLSQSIDFRFYHSSKAPYTFNFFKRYTQVLEGVIIRNTGKLRKAIIFDCDNTLWKGVIGEDGLKGIEMSTSSNHGKFFHRVQQIANFLAKKGVLLALCSKNNEEDVFEVINTHPDMVLVAENIVTKRVNWNDKASNIQEIAAELNIGTDSLVFVDDSSFEINLVKDRLPEVLTIQVPSNISEYPNLLLNYAFRYFNLNANDEDLRRTEIYKEQFQRERSQKEFTTLNDYLASLNIELTIALDDKDNLSRITQLTQKTNQFNLTTIRYTEDQIQNFMQSEDVKVYSLVVKDKFGDNGLTGVCIVKEDLKLRSKVILDTFLMSCRIIGRDIEMVLFDYLVRQLITDGYTILEATYFPTKKNDQVSVFYEKMGMQLIGNNGTKHYSLELSSYQAKEVDYIKLNEPSR